MTWASACCFFVLIYRPILTNIPCFLYLVLVWKFSMYGFFSNLAAVTPNSGVWSIWFKCIFLTGWFYKVLVSNDDLTAFRFIGLLLILWAEITLELFVFSVWKFSWTTWIAALLLRFWSASKVLVFAAMIEPLLEAISGISIVLRLLLLLYFMAVLEVYFLIFWNTFLSAEASVRNFF